MKLLIAFFLKYLLAPLLIIVVLFMMNGIRSVKEKLKVRNVIVYVLLAGLLLGVPGFLSVLQDEYVWGGLFIAIGYYLVMGFLFLYTMHNSIAGAVGIKDSLWGKLLVMFASGVLGAWIHYLLFDYFGGMPYADKAMMLVVWYTLPFMTAMSLKHFHAIPHPLYELWFVGESRFDRTYWDTVDNFQAISVKVRIKRKKGDKEYASFVVRLQDDIILGDWFNWLVEDLNKRMPTNRIQTEDSEDEIGWIFYTPKWISYPLFIRVLDPKRDRLSNKIKKNQTIYIKRVTEYNNKQHEED